MQVVLRGILLCLESGKFGRLGQEKVMRFRGRVIHLLPHVHQLQLFPYAFWVRARCLLRCSNILPSEALNFFFVFFGKFIGAILEGENLFVTAWYY